MIYTKIRKTYGGVRLHIDDIAKGGAMEVEVRCNGKMMNFKGDIALINNHSIFISPIKVNDQTIGFSDNCTINFLYKSEGRLFIWERVSVKLIKYDGEVYHKIDLNGDGKAYNRRDSYRLYIGEDMPLYVNTASGPSALSVLVKDLSETGVGFISKDDLDVERTVRLKLKDNNTIISISGVIVRKEYLDRLGSYLYGCKFNEKNAHLGKYIAKKQGEHLKKKSTYYSSPTSKNKAAKSNVEELV